MKFNLNDYNNNKNRQKISHHIKQASSWSGVFDHEFYLDIKNPPCTCEGDAIIHYKASYDSGTHYEPPSSSVEIDAEIIKIRCEKENGKEKLVDEELMKTVKEYLEEDEDIQEKAFKQKDKSDDYYDRD